MSYLELSSLCASRQATRAGRTGSREAQEEGARHHPGRRRGPHDRAQVFGARRGAKIWSAIPISKTVCRAAELMSAMVRSSICRSSAGSVRALVSGSEIYEVKIDIAMVASSRWKAICTDCARLHRLACRIAAGQALEKRDGAGVPGERRPVPSPARNQDVVHLSRLGRHVQACGGDALWRGRASRRSARSSVHVARRRSRGIDRRRKRRSADDARRSQRASAFSRTTMWRPCSASKSRQLQTRREPRTRKESRRRKAGRQRKPRKRRTSTERRRRRRPLVGERESRWSRILRKRRAR